MHIVLWINYIFSLQSSSAVDSDTVRKVKYFAAVERLNCRLRMILLSIREDAISLFYHYYMDNHQYHPILYIAFSFSMQN